MASLGFFGGAEEESWVLFVLEGRSRVSLGLFL